MTKRVCRSATGLQRQIIVEDDGITAINQVMAPSFSDAHWILRSIDPDPPQTVELEFPATFSVSRPAVASCCRVSIPAPVSEYDAIQLVDTATDVLVLEMKLSNAEYSGFHMRSKPERFGTCDDDPGDLTLEAERHEVLFSWDDEVTARGGTSVEGALAGRPVVGLALDDTRGAAVFGLADE